MTDKRFFDTNILIYAVVNDFVRTPLALEWLAKGGSVSVQVLNEFTNTARRKLNRSWDEVDEAIRAFRLLIAKRSVRGLFHVQTGLSRISKWNMGACCVKVVVMVRQCERSRRAEEHLDPYKRDSSF